MVANVRGYTPNYSFKLINFDTPRWHTLEYANWTLIDALLTQAGVGSIKGEWANSVPYLAGELVIDPEENIIYRCTVAHVSAATGTFAEDRVARPENWLLQIEGVPIYRDEWMPSTFYSMGDIVHYTDYTYYLCTSANTSSASFAADAAHWVTVFDATQVVLDAEAARDAAEASAVDAAASADAAAISEGNAADSATAASGSAAASASAQGAFRWLFDDSTTMADPGLGNFRLNALATPSATELAISSQSNDVGAPDVSDWITTWDDSTNPGVKGTISIRKVGAPENFHVFNLTGAVSDITTWLRVGVTHVVSGGSISDTDATSIAFSRAGNQGLAGPGGGDMLSANNLSELTATAATARTNIGLGATSTPTFAQVAISNAPAAPTDIVTKVYADAINTNANNRVLKAGDVMSGDLQIVKASPNLNLVKSAEAEHNLITGQRGGIGGGGRWAISLADSTPEGVGNTGGNFSVYRYANDGAFLGPAMTIHRTNGEIQAHSDPTLPLGVVTKQYVDTNAATAKVNRAGDTMTGGLTLNYASPNLALNKTAATGQINSIHGLTNNSLRWNFILGDTTTEGGTADGSDIGLNSHNNDGSYKDTVMRFYRASGNMLLTRSLLINDNSTIGKIAIGNYGHIIGRDFTTGKMLIGGGQSTVEINAINPLNIANTTASWSSTSGALTVAGGVGVGGTIRAGGSIVTGASGASGVLYFGNTDLKYLSHDGANYNFSSGHVYVHGGGITCTGPIITYNAANPAVGYVHLGNSGTKYIFTDGTNIGINGGNVYLQNDLLVSSYVQSITTTLLLCGSGGNVALRPYGASNATSQCYVDVNGSFVATNYLASITKGIQSKTGDGNVTGSNWFNTYWTGGGANLYVDYTYLGQLQMVSDYRIKKDVVDLPSTWDIVKQLRPIKYTQAQFTPPSQVAGELKEKMKLEEDNKSLPADKQLEPREFKPLFEADDKERWGFIAHELQETMIMDAATAEKDSPNSVQAPNPWTIIAALTKTIQEMQVRIEALENPT